MKTRRWWLLWCSMAMVLVVAGVLLVKQPRWLVATLSNAICPGAVFYRETTEPLIALTIDDGPDRRGDTPTNTTRQILEVLANYQSQATFFLISDNITPNSQTLVAEMMRQGHELGNHLTTDTASIKLSLQDFTAAIEKAEGAILAATNSRTPLTWLRPGSGFCNREMAAVLQQKHYKTALGSIWPYDTLLASPKFATWQILANARPGSIIVLHDNGPDGIWGQHTATTLRQILPELKQRGYRVVTLSELSSAMR